MIPLSTDWLSISIRIDDDINYTPAHHRWEVYEGGTNVWANRRILYNQYGEKVLTFLSKPKSSCIQKDMALVEIANEWLYHGIDAKSILRKLKKCVPFEVVGLSRLDLAADFVPNKRMCRQIVGLGRGALEVSGKQNGSGFWSVNTDEWMPDVWRGKRCPHCISWGHKESDVKWKLYYKSKELRDAAGGRGFDKPYIVDLWRQCDMDINSVWRLEVSVKHPSKLTFNGEPVGLDTWWNHTLDLFNALYTSRFQLSQGGTRAKGKRCQHIPFLPVKECHAIKCRTYDGERTSNARISLLRQLVKATEQEEVRFDRPTLEDVINSVYGIVTRDGLQRYFEGVTGESVKEWSESLLTECGEETTPMIRDNSLITGGIHPNISYDMPTTSSD